MKDIFQSYGDVSIIGMGLLQYGRLILCIGFYVVVGFYVWTHVDLVSMWTQFDDNDVSMIVTETVTKIIYSDSDL